QDLHDIAVAKVRIGLQHESDHAGDVRSGERRAGNIDVVSTGVSEQIVGPDPLPGCGQKECSTRRTPGRDVTAGIGGGDGNNSGIVLVVVIVDVVVVGRSEVARRKHDAGAQAITAQHDLVPNV